MDNVAFSVVIGLVLILLVLIGFLYTFTGRKEQEEAGNVGVPHGQQTNLPRRAVAARNQRARLRPTAGVQRQNGSDDENEDHEERERNIELPEGKIGAKKRAKLEAKADRKAHREAEEREREERKKKEALKEEERGRREEREQREEVARLEEQRREQEERERREQEEYERMREAFSVEEEGFEEGGGGDDQANLLSTFITHVKEMKVVVLEDLAAHFKMKTQAVIERIQQLQADGNLTGVIDDRGKFIYISQEELEAVAKFVRQRGRVSIMELAESSNKLISLVPTKAEVVTS